MSRIVINNISWNRPDGSNLFKNITFAFNNERTGLTGANGIGKTILAKIMQGELSASSGAVSVEGTVACLPQDLSSLDGKTVLTVLAAEEKCDALARISAGNGTEQDFRMLDDDWNIEEKVALALQSTGIGHIDHGRQFSTLSGGEKIRCAMSALLINKPDFIILDEPTNHLDTAMRQFVYSFVSQWPKGMAVISHDRALLRLMDRIAELTPDELKSYGGNYDFYLEQREAEINAIREDIQAAEAALNKRIADKETTLLKQEIRTRKVAKTAHSDGIPKSVINKRRGRSEQTLSKLTLMHQKRVDESSDLLTETRSKLPPARTLKIDFTNSDGHAGKKIVVAENVNFSFDGKVPLWGRDLSFVLHGNERVWLNGNNGSGKSTLLKMISGELTPTKGKLSTNAKRSILIDQNISLLDYNLTVYENIFLHSGGTIPEHELRIRLARFLFFKDDVFKLANVLSGGERVRAAMACVFAAIQTPELILLDEPTNNLDLKSIEQLTAMLNEYAGALLVVSHDTDFIADIGVERELQLNSQAGGGK